MEKRSIIRLRGHVVMWLFEEQQASFEEIANVLHCTRERVRQIFEREKAERERIAIQADKLE